MKIFDKASWHIDAGENKEMVIDRLSAVMDYLNRHNMLSEDGIEIFQIGVDSSFSLHEKMVNEKGLAFLSEHYDSMLQMGFDELKSFLQNLADTNEF